MGYRRPLRKNGCPPVGAKLVNPPSRILRNGCHARGFKANVVQTFKTKGVTSFKTV
jgi:hypothetical protein